MTAQAAAVFPFEDFFGASGFGSVLVSAGFDSDDDEEAVVLELDELAVLPPESPPEPEPDPLFEEP